jgi:galactokinase
MSGASSLIEKINGAGSAPVFSRLYGAENVEAGRKRYTELVEGLFALSSGAAADVRLLTAAGRTELGGNHTDHNKGKVIAASIQLDAVAAAARRDDKKVVFRSTGHADVRLDLSDLSPREGEKGTTEALVRGVAAAFARRGLASGGFDANAASTVLGGSGLSSSAAVEVLFAVIFDSLYNGSKLPPLEIAQMGQFAENVYFGKPCGLMDQCACAYGGLIAIDFAGDASPAVTRLDFDLDAIGYSLCVVNTRGSHADLTADYAAIPSEMRSVAAFFGKSFLAELDEKVFLPELNAVRKAVGDRAVLRTLHFFAENRRVDAMVGAVERYNSAASGAERMGAFENYLSQVRASGDSSWEELQNVSRQGSPAEQTLAVALAYSRNILASLLRTEGKPFAVRVHGGGFAGTIQCYLPKEALGPYKSAMEAVFGEGCLTCLRVRPVGAAEVFG